MIARNLLEKIGFLEEDITFILELNIKHSHKIMKMVNEYVSSLKKEFIVPYKDGEREKAHYKAIRFIEDVQRELPELDTNVSRLLGWINCIPYLEKDIRYYVKNDDVFYESMRDFVYKLKECQDVYDVSGLFTDWFFLFFEFKLFSLGRLQYEVSTFEYEKYSYRDFNLKKGDMVYSCHIPSGGKLTIELCMDSFQKAYNFFKPQLHTNIIPIICESWLFYKPYNENVFSEGSNLKRFVELFDIIDSNSSGDKFEDCWRVFNKIYNGNTIELPCDNTLRRSFIKYINSGGDFGNGYGVLLYDGEKKEIVNQR